MSSRARFLAVVARIPRGRVATYGQVALFAGYPRQARQVGWALAAIPEGNRVPWQRVVNAKGRISPRGGLGGDDSLQRFLLEREGIAFDSSGSIPFERFLWRPRRSRPARGSRS